LLLVGIGSGEQECLTDLGDVVALATRYSLHIFLQVRSELEELGTAPNPYVDERLSRAD
jgi:hypothetical protein